MAEQQDKLVEKLTEALNNIGLDIREIKTTLRHFDEKFGRVQEDLSDFRIQVGENEHEVEGLKIKIVREEERTKEHDASIKRLFKMIEENKKEAKADRKWLIGTIIGVVTTLIGFAFKLFGM